MNILTHYDLFDNSNKKSDKTDFLLLTGTLRYRI